MSTRDEYVASLKNQLDLWNAEVGRWEARAAAAKDEARKRYAAQLERLDARREKALYALRLLENASAAAWADFRWCVDDAWDRMHDAMKEARSHFERARPPKPRDVPKRQAPTY